MKSDCRLTGHGPVLPGQDLIGVEDGSGAADAQLAQPEVAGTDAQHFGDPIRNEPGQTRTFRRLRFHYQDAGFASAGGAREFELARQVDYRKVVAPEAGESDQAGRIE